MDDGTLEQTDRGWQLRFERRLPHPPAKVWRALTEPEHLAAWFPTTIEGERRAGAPLRFAFPMDDGPVVEGELRTWDPPEVFEFQWDTDIVRFELRPDGAEGCLLTFTTVIDEVGTGARDAAGWDVCLDVLTHHLAGTTPPWDPETRWRDVHPRYVERLPAEASTIGPPEGSDVEG